MSMKTMFRSAREYLASGTGDLKEKATAVNWCLERAKEMQGRSSCPCCQQDIDKEAVEDDFKWFSEKREEIKSAIEKKEEAERPAAVARAAALAKEREEFDRDVAAFLPIHKKEMLRAINAERNGKAVSKPAFGDERSKNLWNAGMRKLFVDRKDDIDYYDDIMYEV